MQISTYKDYKKGNEEWMPLIPSHWKLTRFQWIGSFESGKAHEPFVDDDGDYICVNSRFISTNGKVIKRCTKNITPASPGDTLAVMSDLPNGRALARAFYVEHKDIYAVNQRVCRLSPGKEWARFIYWLIDRNPGLLWFDDGFNQTHIPNSGYTKLAIALPPLEEQKSISSFLDQETAKIDDLITEQERLIELLQEKRQAVISHAVTKGLNPNAPMKDSGVEWLGEVPEHWTIGKLSYYASLDTGSTPDRQRSEYWNGEIPWVKTGEVKYEDIHETEERITALALQETSCSLQQPGTLLMALYGQGITRGRVGMLMTAASCNQACAAITPSTGLNGRYLELYLTNAYSHLRSLGNETTQQNLNLDFVGKLELLVPPLSEQECIWQSTEQTTNELDALLLQSSHAINLLKERRSSLISAAVTGQIDVRGLVPKEEAI